MIWFGLVWFYGISTIMLYTVMRSITNVIHIHIHIQSNTNTQSDSVVSDTNGFINF